MRILMAAAILLLSCIAAQSWPDKNIRVFVPFPAGNGSDIIARKILSLAEKELGQKIVIENRPGGGGTLAPKQVLKAEADGYTLLYGTSAILSAVVFGREKPYKISDFVPISMVAQQQFSIALPKGRYKDEKDFIERAGGGFYCTLGYGGGSHIAALLYQKKHGFSGTAVPFKGSVDTLNETMAGRLDYCAQPETLLRPLEAEGRIDVIRPGQYRLWNIMFAPKGVPSAVIEKLATAMENAKQSDEFRSWAEKLGVIVPPKADISSLLKNDQTMYERLSLELHDNP